MSSVPRVKQKEYDREDLEQVDQFLVKVRRRLRLVEAVRLISLCIFASSALLIAGRIFTLCVPTVHAMHTWFSVAAAAVILIPVVVAALIASTRKYSLLFLARYSDEKLDLKDQLATAMSVGLSLMHPTFAKMVVGDAAVAASSADAKRVVTVRWGPAQTAAVATFALACVVTAIPGRPLSMANMKKPE